MQIEFAMRIPELVFVTAVLACCGGDDLPSSIDASSIDAALQTTPCPPTDDLECESASQACVVTGPFGPTTMSRCQAVPPACDADRSCDCLEATLCPTGTIGCSEPAANTIFCDNGTQ